MGVNYFVDSANGDDTDDGTTMDNGPGGGTGAWATIEHAHEAGGLSAGDIVWVRRTHIEYAGNPTSNIDLIYDGTAAEPIKTIGWPRAEIPNTTITSATWTNGSTTVDLIVGITCDRTEHCARFATAPNGDKLLITKITDANTLIIDREYAGATVTGTDGKFSIDEDEDYDLAQAIDDSGFTIKVADWTADDDSMPCVDFKDQAYGIKATGEDWLEWKNLEVRDAAGAGCFYFDNQSQPHYFQGCLLHNDNNTEVLRGASAHGAWIIDRCVITASGSGTSQDLINNLVGPLFIYNSALYDAGNYAVSATGYIYLENVNLGVEGNCADADARLSNNCYGRDVKWGNSSTEIDNSRTSWPVRRHFENHNKVLGVHKIYANRGTMLSVTAGAGGDIPNQRTDGNTILLEVDFDASAYDGMLMDFTEPIFTAEFDASTDSKDYRIYIQNIAEIAAAKLRLVCEYVSSYDDATEYVITKTEGTTSNSPIPARADADDWDEYIEVTGIQPAVASTVRLLLYTNFYHATDQWYVDPLCQPTDT